MRGVAATEEAEILRHQKISEAKKGKKHTEAHRKAMSEARKKLFAEGKLRPSRTSHTPEMCEHLSKTTKQAWTEGRLNSTGLTVGQTRTRAQRSAAWTPEKRAAQALRTTQAYKEGRMVVHGRYRGQWTRYEGPQGTINMRSKSEALFARHLDSIGVNWQYEPQRFDLGWSTYCPDFYLPKFDRWIEVKGSWSEKARRKFEEFGRDHCVSAVLAQDILKFASLSDDSFADGKQEVLETSIKEVA